MVPRWVMDGSLCFRLFVFQWLMSIAWIQISYLGSKWSNWWFLKEGGHLDGSQLVFGWCMVPGVFGSYGVWIVFDHCREPKSAMSVHNGQNKKQKQNKSGHFWWFLLLLAPLVVRPNISTSCMRTNFGRRITAHDIFTKWKLEDNRWSLA